MLKYVIFVIMLITLDTAASAREHLIINTYNRSTTSLNGYWQYIVDPYENGYYNYRYEPFDQQKQPWKSAFFLN